MDPQNRTPVTSRAPTEEELFFEAWFAEQEKTRIGRLEEGARQVVQLVTAFYGIIFGIFSVNPDSFLALFAAFHVQAVGIVTVVALLIALICALIVLAPLSYHYQRHNISSEADTYYLMLDRKLNFLYYAIWAFGTALTFFGVLLILIITSG